MALKLNEAVVTQIINEIEGSDEVDRRADIQKRLEIYRNGGKRFLIEQIKREFGEESVNEMRLATLNVLKKIVDRRASIYKEPPIRTAQNDQDQDLVDFYAQELEIDQVMLKAHRYLVLNGNTAIYPIPSPDGSLKIPVVPSSLYSVVPKDDDQTKIDVWVFNQFTESGRVAPDDGLSAATGRESYSRDRSTSESTQFVDANQRSSQTDSRTYIFWTDNEHVTVRVRGTNNSRIVEILSDPDRDELQFVNPLGQAPVINLARDRDNTPWAEASQDLVDNAQGFQLVWSDILTIAKHQGYAILTVVSPEEPQRLTVGVNRAIWLRQQPDGPTPTISYVNSNSPLAEYKDLAMEYLALILTTNDMPPNSVTGSAQTSNVTSGFQALIESADLLQAIECDKPLVRDAEKSMWNLIKLWHNWMFDNSLLRDDFKSFGKFTEDFDISIIYRDIKPIESEAERLSSVERLMSLGLITRAQAMKKLHPDLSDDQVEQRMQEIADEMQQIRERVALLGGPVGEVQPEDDV